MGITEEILPAQQILFNYHNSSQPDPGSAEELRLFEQIQKEFSNQFELFFPDNLVPL